jgi:ubiquinone/menaquinone biosynthesis C-methylase UbiE
MQDGRYFHIPGGTKTMTLTDQIEFDKFFQGYAGNVDGFNEAAYWRLSDELIKELIRRHMGLNAGDSVVDAGGGTGRWGMWLANEFAVNVTIADKSEDMLKEAQAKVQQAGLGESISLVPCDLENAAVLESASADAILSTYGVLSFLNDPQAAFNELFRVMKPNGVGLLMSHSLSNALTSKTTGGSADAEELRELLNTSIVRWAPHVPALRVFTAEDLTRLATSAGFQVEAVFGVTSVVLPGPEDFGYPYTTHSAVSKALQNEDYFQTVLELELAATEKQGWAERGVNLMIKVRRPL